MLFDFARPFLHALDPEQAHSLTIAALKAGIHPRRWRGDPKILQTRVLGLNFPNPVGIAAGFDKNAEVPDAMLGIGFGFTEIGTVTPRPQSGNPKPRMFRLPRDRGAINRLGFNNEGHDAVRHRLEARRRRPGILGVNIGANKDTDDMAADYVLGLKAFYGLASYFTVNISSPNTPGLRGLQSKDLLDDLIMRLLAARAELAPDGAAPTPLLIKIAPDLVDEELADIAAVCLERRVDGVIISNTTISRDNLRDPNAREQGGLSGTPLLELSTRVLREFHRATGTKVPLIGVGGVSSADTAYAKITAGASLVQLYTGLIYAGPALLSDIKTGLAFALERDGFKSLEEAVGAGG